MNDAVILEDFMEIIENKYIAANMAAKRARWLNEKKRLPTIKTDALKETTIALEELLANKLGYKIVQPEESKEVEELVPIGPPTSEEEKLEEESESLFDEEYIDDRKMVVEDEEPEEGI